MTTPLQHTSLGELGGYNPLLSSSLGELGGLVATESTGGWGGLRALWKPIDRIREVIPKDIPLEMVVEVLDSQPIEQAPEVSAVLDQIREITPEQILAQVDLSPIGEELSDIDRQIQLELALARVLEILEQELIARILLDVPLIEVPQRPLSLAEIILLLD